MIKEYKDQIAPAGGRRYTIEAVEGGSKITDVTEYEQEGTKFGAMDVQAGCLLECTCVKTGNVFALTCPNANVENLKFVAPSDYTAGDSITLNGTTMTLKTITGEVPSDGYFANGSVVTCVRSGNTLYFGQDGFRRNETIDIAHGGTGATTVTDARRNLKFSTPVRTDGSATAGQATFTTLHSTVIPEGTYLVTANIRFDSNANGIRQFAMYRASDGNVISETRVLCGASPADNTVFTSAAIISVTSETAYDFKCYQNSGNSLGVRYFISFIRIA